MTLTAPSSPPPPAVSPEHVTARVDSSEEEAAWTPVHEPPVHGSSAHEPRVNGPSTHEPRVDGSSAHEPRVDGPSAHETPEEHTSGWGTWSGQHEEPSGHADDGVGASGHADDDGEPTDIEEGATSTSVVLHGSRPCRRPASRGG